MINVILILAGLLILNSLLDYWHMRWQRRVVKEFAEKFPGRCFICSFAQAFGQQPEPHVCIEWHKESKETE